MRMLFLLEQVKFQLLFNIYLAQSFLFIFTSANNSGGPCTLRIHYVYILYCVNIGSVLRFA